MIAKRFSIQQPSGSKKFMSRTRTVNPWLQVQESAPEAILCLFCFPYAGGSATVFSGWSEGLPATIEVRPIQLPGRGARLMEHPINRTPELVEAVAEALIPHLDKPFAFFGHSMGAIIIFELARYLRAECNTEPLHLFVSGSLAPQIRLPKSPTYKLSDAAFVEKLRQLNGTPPEILEHYELMRLVTPSLRADYELAETYTYLKSEPLACPITAFGGLGDKLVSQRQLQAWDKQTAATFSLQMFRGDHFFIHSSKKLVLKALSTKLNGIARRIARKQR